MQKTEGKKTVIVVDEQGKKYESTYPKRANGLVKNGRARYIDENTILLISCPAKINDLEDSKMNNETKIDTEYIINKVDEILQINKELAKMATLDITQHENPIESICKTNDRMIGFLREIYFSQSPRPTTNEDTTINGYMKILDKIINDEVEGDNLVEIVGMITDSINRLNK